MDVIGQDADGNSLERQLLLYAGIGAPQAFDVTDQQIAATVGKRKGEKERSGLDFQSTIAGYPS